MKFKFEKKKFNAESRVLISWCSKILDKYKEQGLDLTV